jgi:hypothetical protein
MPRIQDGTLTSGDNFGTREYLQNNYLYRMAGAALGIYGNSKEEAIYPAYYADEEGQPLDGANRYILRFAPGQEPPVNSFRSITLMFASAATGASPASAFGTAGANSRSDCWPSDPFPAGRLPAHPATCRA